jgi:hypothetical protein
MDATSRDDLRAYAWNYFQLHAQQRLQAFEFYISLASAATGGFLALLSLDKPHKWFSVVGLLLMLLSFIFWKLDNRTRQLICNAENALKHLDSELAPSLDGDHSLHPLQLFARDDEQVKGLLLYPLMSGHFTYSRCFRWMFCCFSLIGLAVAIYCLAAFPV